MTVAINNLFEMFLIFVILIVLLIVPGICNIPNKFNIALDVILHLLNITNTSKTNLIMSKYFHDFVVYQFGYHMQHGNTKISGILEKVGAILFASSYLIS